MTIVVALAAAAGAAVAAYRWLLVAQREHYIPGAATTFAQRWWWGIPVNRLLFAALLVSAAGAFVAPAAAFVTALAAAGGPFGFPMRPKAPGPVAWTRRLRTLAATVVAVYGVLVLVGWATGLLAAFAATGAAAMPALVDVGLMVTRPLERKLARRWVDEAASRLRKVSPRVVGITGSYGKTSTKMFAAHLASASRSVVASPRSFNNAAGLAMTINEHLALGTDVFIAEMGTYGPGEIAEMCEWMRPDVSAITAIGPVHLERFGTEEQIVEAKREILDPASVAILNCDDKRLASLADWAEVGGKRAVRCSASDRGADVCARYEDGDLVVYTSGKEIARAAGLDVHPTNVACAVAIALEVGARPEAIAERLGGLPSVPNRLTIGTGSSGATVLDDTFNSNPAGAAAALEAGRRHLADGGRLVVVTPGMIELGPRQYDENAAFARQAAVAASHIIVVGQTNRRALVDGANDGGAEVEVVVVDSRDAATDWVKENVGPGDVVLYENDLPDHHP